MKTVLRVALLGGGKMAVQHATAVRQCQGAQLVAVADPNVSPDDLRARFGSDLAVFDDLDTMLGDANPDVVHIVTPPDSHSALAEKCLRAGKHVYVEKPFALTTAEARSVLRLAEERKLQVCAAHQLLFQESALAYRQDLPTIGDIKHVESFFSFKPVRRSSSGGGLTRSIDQLIDILPHPVYLLLDALAGEGPAELAAVDVSCEGEVRAAVRRGSTLGTLVVTLNARPVESFLKVMGTNGSVEVDFVIGNVVRHFGPGASAPAVILKPFSRAWQIAWGSLKGLAKLVFRKNKSYPGLSELLARFYDSARTGTASPISADQIVTTVRLCEEIGSHLHSAEATAERLAADRLARIERDMAPRLAPRGTVLLTGGTGFLGKAVASELQQAGFRVRVPVRRELPYRQRLPGVEYVPADLGASIPATLLSGIDLVIHAAAETAGGLPDHERNTVQATRNLLDAMVHSGCRRLVNVSSVAVLKPSSRGPQNEQCEVDVKNLSRGPYVYAKAAAETDAASRDSSGAISVRTVRLGPLVDFGAFAPPGRLGREVARLFVAMGSRRNPMSVCSTSTAAAVIRSYAERFDAAPSCVNLLEVPAPTRGQLVERLRAVRPDLKVMWMPFPILRAISIMLKVALRLLRPGQAPLDLYAAFKSESYDPSVASAVIAAAGDPVVESTQS